MNPDDMSPEEVARLQQEQCIFCKIISGQIPSSKIYEDDNVLAILDINPASEGHVILLPKKHYQIMPQIPDQELSNLFLTSKKLSKSLLQAFQTGGTSIFVANGGVAGQRAPHFMIHIVPRRDNDGLFNIPLKEGDNSKLIQIQQALIANLSKAFGRPVVETKKPEPNPQPPEPSQPTQSTPEPNNFPQENSNPNNTQPDDDNDSSDLDKISGMFLK